ncbi:MAG: hypothetical protein ABUT20_48420 [Bacteroidota bacterium]
MKKSREDLKNQARGCLGAIHKLMDTFDEKNIQSELELIYVGFMQSKLSEEQGATANSNTAFFFLELQRFFRDIERNHQRFGDSFFKEFDHLYHFLASTGLIDQFISFKRSQEAKKWNPNVTVLKITTSDFAFHPN